MSVGPRCVGSRCSREPTGRIRITRSESCLHQASGAGTSCLRRTHSVSLADVVDSPYGYSRDSLLVHAAAHTVRD